MVSKSRLSYSPTRSSRLRSAKELAKNRPIPAIDCIIVLGHIKFQSAVDPKFGSRSQHWRDSCTPSVAWAAQQLTINAFREKFDTRTPREIRCGFDRGCVAFSRGPHRGCVVGRWEVEDPGSAPIHQRSRLMLERHVQQGKALDNKVLINLIHGMHACIPRGNYGSASPIVSFLSGALLRKLRLAVVRGQGRAQSSDHVRFGSPLAPEQEKPLVEPEDRVRRPCLGANRCTR
jgi:hypothetical protein